jgi:hypothetical protein
MQSIIKYHIGTNKVSDVYLIIVDTKMFIHMFINEYILDHVHNDIAQLICKYANVRIHNDTMHGQYAKYDTNGNLCEILCYKLGFLDGINYVFRVDGTLYKSSLYINNKMIEHSEYNKHNKITLYQHHISDCNYYYEHFWYGAQQLMIVENNYGRTNKSILHRIIQMWLSHKLVDKIIEYY